MNNTNYRPYILALIIIIWLVGGVFFFQVAKVYAAEDKKQSDLYQNLQLFNEVLIKLKQNYVTDLDNEEIIKAAINGMLSSTDPHTTFFDADEFSEFTTQTEGEFGGLGIQIDKKGDYITVVSPMEGTPAYKMGLAAGDRIVKVDGISIVSATTDEAIKKMRGPVGTKVTLTISRPGVPEPMDFEIVRDIIKIKSVPYAFKLDNGVGYIRLSQFSKNSDNELKVALDTLEAQGIKGLIIDLRYNPGGLLDQAIDTVNEFIGPNKLVVETKGKTPNSNHQYFTRYPRKPKDYPIVVLVNEASASAAEIFAGSLQDWDKGLIAGKPTFGKGSVQQLFPLSNGGGVKITTAYYYIKSGRCIHKVLNDKLLTGKEVTEAEKQELDKKAHDTIYYTVKGREVYGGGGITPDLQFEPDLLTNFGVELRRKNTFFNFAVDYMVKHNHSVPENYRVDDATFNQFLDYARQQDIKFTQADVDSIATFIRTSLAGEIIGKKYGDQAAYKVTLQLDTQLQKAAELFDNYKTLDQMFAYAAQQNKKIKK
ncbi:MAG: S41 family peptidase [Candidatus Cloacimonadaceae bacterium]